ncbi:polya polymerase [Blautia marasmi]|uniref:polya polymerase n=1 Tax=Blautia marasmi TaxID=1917868 RepID=UPI00266C8C70|nr:polya polymerase [Blautia marasmi]
MKLKESIDLVNFLRQVQKCKGEIYLETEDGDKLNLKSTLSQYVCVVLAENKDILRNSEITIATDEDIEVLSCYLQECCCGGDE